MAETSRTRLSGVEGGTAIVEQKSERVVVVHKTQLVDHLVGTPPFAL